MMRQLMAAAIFLLGVVGAVILVVIGHPITGVILVFSATLIAAVMYRSTPEDNET
jgi:hypothetical protein